MYYIPEKQLLDPFTDAPAVQVAVNEKGEVVNEIKVTVSWCIRQLLQSFNLRDKDGSANKYTAPTMEDCYHGCRVLDAIKPFKDIKNELSDKPRFITLEAEDFKWIKGVHEKRSPFIFNFLAQQLKEVFEVKEDKKDDKKDEEKKPLKAFK